ncbi:N-chimaerin [Echinococcus granulosus]|uniref:N chimaerin n=1 Tax=Echinococcus granulosus TaxID=6210 RepID=A0A068WK28_ECHGR|nr:N-chimaerin [Echinococcus granulosus]CDS20133.1 N chimaerin [Echinococcus granulosus]
MVDRRSDMRTWQNKLYNLQREAPKPFPVVCFEHLNHVPHQYGAAYHGPLSRQGTEELLSGQPSGAYLIRDSQRADGAFTLAIRFDDSTKNYKLFYDSSSQLHYVGEKKFESVDQLVADGLIYLHIETRGADILQKLSEASNYEHSPYYKTRYHTVNAVPPPTRPSVAAISSANYRRQSSLELFDGSKKPSPIRLIQSTQSAAADEVANGVINDPPKKPSAALSGSVDKPSKNQPKSPIRPQLGLLALLNQKTGFFRFILELARSTSLPFSKQRIELALGPSTAPVAKPDCSTDTTGIARSSTSSGSSSGHASLKTRQPNKGEHTVDDGSGGESRRRKAFGGVQHHRTLASTLPVNLDGANMHTPGRISGEVAITCPTATPAPTLVHVDVEKAHNFRIHTFRGPHWCDFCTHFIWGLVSQGVKCTDCGFQAHKRCSLSVPNDCLPDMKRLKRVFGVDLTSLVRAENRTVPQVLVKCITELERRGGLVAEGVYRVPGNQEIVEDFRIALDKDCESVDLSEKRCNDLNTITSLIKSFLRQLPIPLITYEAYPELIDIARDEQLSEEQKHDFFKGCIQRLPSAHYYCLRYLMAHLNRVAEHQRVNMMSSENLAIVFAPSLMSSSYTDPLSCLAGAKFEQAVVIRLITDFPTIFDGDDCVPSAPPSSSASTTTSRSTNASLR